MLPPKPSPSLKVPSPQALSKPRNSDSVSHILKIVPVPNAKQYGFKRYQTMNLQSTAKKPIEKKNTQLSMISPSSDSMKTSSMQSLSLNYSPSGGKAQSKPKDPRMSGSGNLTQFTESCSNRLNPQSQDIHKLMHKALFARRKDKLNLFSEVLEKISGL